MVNSFYNYSYSNGGWTTFYGALGEPGHDLNESKIKLLMGSGAGINYQAAGASPQYNDDTNICY